jgi:rare lipoprotein A (peptidoglycan hydrolase)
LAESPHTDGAAQGDRLPDGRNNEADLAEPTVPASAHPISTEIGKASWYGPPYHNRVGSNGEVYNMHAMTAAHRTLPLGSIVRVTNLKTKHTALVRITDRGPFVPGRILDLSLAAAHKIDVYRPGVAEVKVEVMQTPAPTISRAATARPKCSTSAAPLETGGCGFACSMTTANALSKLPRKPTRRKEQFFW